MKASVIRRLGRMMLLSILVCAGLLFSSTAVATAAPVGTLATCFASSCHGLDANATGCASDAITARSATSPEGISVQLRYSATCRAAWGRITNGIVGDRVRVERNDGANFASTISSGSDTFTRMVNDANFLSRACVRATVTNSLTCTGSF